MSALKTLFLDLLSRRYDSENRLILAMPAMAKISTCHDYRKLIQRHFRETIAHAKKLEIVFRSFGAEVNSRQCEATIGLLKNCDEIAVDYKGSPALNAALISCSQKIEHHEIASYGCLAEWSTLLGNKEATSLLREVLSEEKAADQALSFLARSGVNAQAAGESRRTPARPAARSSTRRPGLRPRTFNRTHPVLM